MDDYLIANKDHWDKLTTAHVNSKFYDLEGFKRGKSGLTKLELEEVGEVKKKTLLHLQCHFGLGTLSWAREGAIATGIDLSEKSIALAKRLSKEVGLKADFVSSDIYSLPKVLDKKFDIVFTSFGVLPWLPDIKRWAEVITNFLKPAGMFYIVEDHPLMGIFNHDFEISYSYFKKDPSVEESEGSYADRNAKIKTTTYQWNHTLSDILNSLLEQKLKIEFLHEFPFSAWEPYPGLMKRDNEGWYKFKNEAIQIPLLFSIKAFK